jgi:small subunit ribosomal protein S9
MTTIISLVSSVAARCQQRNYSLLSSNKAQSILSSSIFLSQFDNIMCLSQHLQQHPVKSMSTNSTTLSKPKYRLRRPPARLNRIDTESTGQSFGVPYDKNSRPGVVTLFPGDFQDDDDEYSSNWDDDDNFDSEENAEAQEANETTKLLLELKRRDEELVRKKQRWIEVAKTPERVPLIDERGRAYGRGGRKTAAARVWIQAGYGEIVINQRPFDEYFDRISDRDLILEPLVATETCGMFDLQCIVEGGGLTGQAGAIRLGLSNALNAYNPELYRPSLKILGLLTRDTRKVERKKIGHKKARKSPQWVRR